MSSRVYVRRVLWREAARTACASLAITVVFLLLAAASPERYFHDDMQSEYLGASRAIYEALRHGELPVVSTQSWFGGDLAGEYQYGVFSVFVLALDFVAWSLHVSLRGTATVLLAVHVAILAGGTFRLARAHSRSVAASVLVAATASLNGWILFWGTAWYPALVSFAWLPWLAWSACARGWGSRARAVGVAVFLYLVLAGGWPFTALMAAIVLVVETVRGSPRRGSGRVGVFAGVVLGVALATPALVALAELAPATRRIGAATLEPMWAVPPSAVASLVLPVARAAWCAWDAVVRDRVSLEMTNGVLPTLLLLAAITSGRVRTFARARAEVALAVAGLVLACLPAPSPLRFAFRWLPLFHLALGLLAARALDALSRDRPCASEGRVRALVASPASWCALAGAITWATAGGAARRAADAIAVTVPDPSTTVTADGPVLLAVGMIAAAGVLAIVRRRRPRESAGVVVLVALGLQALTVDVVRPHELLTWPLSEMVREHGPYDPRRTYLALYRFDDLLCRNERCPEVRIGDIPMFSDLTYVGGYSPMRWRPLVELFDFRTLGDTTSSVTARVVRDELGPGRLLARLGIDGLVLPEPPTPDSWADAWTSAAGWSRIPTTDGARVYHRSGEPLPFAWALGTAAARTTVDVVEARATRVRIRVKNDDTAAESIVVVKRASYPGFVARLGGARVPIVAHEGVLLAAVVPAGADAELVFSFEPAALRWAPWVSLVSLVSLLALAFPNAVRGSVRSRASRPHRKPPSGPELGSGH